MGIATWTSANRITESPLVTRYTVEAVASTDNGVDAYALTRNRTKRFRYTGLSKAAATACAAEMKDRYTRWILDFERTNGSTFRPATVQYPMSSRRPKYKWQMQGRSPVLFANVTTAKIGPDMYDVEVDLDETITIYDSYFTIDDAAIERIFVKYYGELEYDE